MVPHTAANKHADAATICQSHVVPYVASVRLTERIPIRFTYFVPHMVSVRLADRRTVIIPDPEPNVVPYRFTYGCTNVSPNHVGPNGFTYGCTDVSPDYVGPNELPLVSAVSTTYCCPDRVSHDQPDAFPDVLSKPCTYCIAGSNDAADGQPHECADQHSGPQLCAITEPVQYADCAANSDAFRRTHIVTQRGANVCAISRSDDGSQCGADGQSDCGAVTGSHSGSHHGSNAESYSGSYACAHNSIPYARTNLHSHKCSDYFTSSHNLSGTDTIAHAVTRSVTRSDSGTLEHTHHGTFSLSDCGAVCGTHSEPYPGS